MDNILVIDDDLIILDMVSKYFKNNFNVVTCSSSDDALKVINDFDSKFAAILLDISMPKQNGIEICKLIKKQEKFKFTPILFVTSYNKIDLIRDGFSAGATDYIIKPFKFEELRIRLEKHIHTSKEEEKLFEQYLLLNEQIIQLTKELNEKRNSLNEENFQHKESVFSRNDKIIQSHKLSSKEFQDKINIIQDKLIEQKKMIERTKKLLNN